MPITDKQRKLIWIGAALAGTYFFAPTLINHARQAFSTPEPTIAKPSAAKPAPIAPTPVVVTPQQASEAQIARQLTGDWIGGGVQPALGLCRVGLQIKRDPLKEDTVTGYSTTSCNPAFALTGQTATRENRARAAAIATAPTSVIMTGKVSATAIDFTIDKSIGVPIDGCSITSFTATPFGEALAAEWKAGTCQGGQMILKKVASIQ